MSRPLPSLAQRLNAPSEATVSWHPDAPGHDLPGIRAMAATVAQAIADDSRDEWLVVDENAARFLAAFLGVLAGGGIAVLPQHGGRDAVLSHRDARRGLVSGEAALSDVSDVQPVANQGEGETLSLSRSARLTLFTSGSTGEPKQVNKTLAQLEDECRLLESGWGEALGQARVVVTVPHFHLYGLLFRLLWPFAAGRCFPELALLEPPRIAAAVQAAERSVLVSSPAHLKRWPGYTALAGQGLETVFSSAGPLPADTSLAIHQALDPVAVWEVYGSTETGGIAWRDQGRAGYRDWQVFAGVTLDFPQGQPGPMSVCSPATGDQWIETGDRVECLADPGKIRLLGRSDGVIKVEDRRISLAEIESALEASEWVREAAVLRLDGERQTIAAALVLTESGERALHEQGKWQFKRQLRSRLATRFTEVALPRRFRYLERLPRNPMGKLRRQDLLPLFGEAGV